MSALVLVDTSAWTQALRRQGDSSVRERVEKLLAQESAAWCEMIRLELWSGVRGEEERRKLAHMDAVIPRMPITDEVWALACKYASVARASGLTVPASDLAIYALKDPWGLAGTCRCSFCVVGSVGDRVRLLNLGGIMSKHEIIIY